jgi:hypothetical protein
MEGNKEGRVKLETFFRFNRIKWLLSQVSNARNIWLYVLKLSLKDSKLIQMNWEDKTVRRVSFAKRLN